MERLEVIPPAYRHKSSIGYFYVLQIIDVQLIPNPLWIWLKQQLLIEQKLNGESLYLKLCDRRVVDDYLGR
ncbi:hypothetical protein T06_9682 [Trichinella sp. T6]|nr:hypothetical protein T06_9682 [Trichinella sp. T6]